MEEVAIPLCEMTRFPTVTIFFTAAIKRKLYFIPRSEYNDKPYPVVTFTNGIATGLTEFYSSGYPVSQSSITKLFFTEASYNYARYS